MLILNFLMSILSRHSRHFLHAQGFPFYPKIKVCEIVSSRQASKLASGRERKMRLKAISDLLKCKYLKKECKQFHWRVSFILDANKLPFRIVDATSGWCRSASFYRLCYVSKMQIFNEFKSIVRLNIPWCTLRDW